LGNFLLNVNNVVTATKIKTAVLWDVTSCSVAAIYQHFRDTICFLLWGRRFLPWSCKG